MGAMRRKLHLETISLRRIFLELRLAFFPTEASLHLRLLCGFAGFHAASLQKMRKKWKAFEAPRECHGRDQYPGSMAAQTRSIVVSTVEIIDVSGVQESPSRDVHVGAVESSNPHGFPPTSPPRVEQALNLPGTLGQGKICFVLFMMFFPRAFACGTLVMPYICPPYIILPVFLISTYSIIIPTGERPWESSPFTNGY